jgi:protein-L-isoaspartate(D-aspartate) O-methyltransferase
VPTELLAQLKPGGRLVAIEGDDPIMSAVRYTQGAEGVVRTPLVETNAKRLVGFPETPRFHF